MKRTTMALLAVAGAYATLALAHDPVAERHEMMEDTREALKPMVGMVRGEREFDAALVAGGLETMQHTAAHFGALFPEGSQSKDSEARPEIWTDREGFESALADFAEAVDAAASKAPESVDQLQTALSAITKTCKGCHDHYRLDDD